MQRAQLLTAYSVTFGEWLKAARDVPDKVEQSCCQYVQSVDLTCSGLTLHAEVDGTDLCSLVFRDFSLSFVLTDMCRSASVPAYIIASVCVLGVSALAWVQLALSRDYRRMRVMTPYCIPSQLFARTKDV